MESSPVNAVMMAKPRRSPLAFTGLRLADGGRAVRHVLRIKFEVLLSLKSLLAQMLHFAVFELSLNRGSTLMTWSHSLDLT